jgi:CheY-like chemotaxis protein
MDNNKLIILAIDDNKDNLVVLRALVSDLFPDAKFIEAGSGKTGFELCKVEKPDVVLLDIVMPEMDMMFA